MVSTPTNDPEVMLTDFADRKQRRVERMKQRTVLSDCVVMLRYALDESCPLSESLIDDVAKVDAILIAAGDDPLSERPASLLHQQTDIADEKEGIDQLLLRVHNALSNLVSPATALSLRATDPELVKWGLPYIAKFAIVGALLSTLGFILSVAKPAAKTGQTSAAPTSSASAQATPTASPKP